MKVFLGGTCGSSTWRNKLIPLLTVQFFNPVVPNWTPECQAIEEKEKDEADIRLYVLTPETSSTYSIAEVVDDSNKLPSKTVFMFIETEDFFFSKHEKTALTKIGEMVKANGATWIVGGLDDLAAHLNS